MTTPEHAAGATRAYVGIGSNLGDRIANLRMAVDSIRATARARLRSVSPVFETAPVGGPEQGDYLNGALGIDWCGDARSLLARLLEIEHRAGRVRAERDGPRTLDLDLLLFGDQILEEPSLCIPHPRMHERGFVLEPLSRVAADVVHPLLAEPVSELAARTRRAADVRPFADASVLVR